PLERIVRIQATGGTTGQPMRLGLTRRDIADYDAMDATALWTMGCRPGDVVFGCMNYSLYSGGLSDHLTFETLGAATIPFGVGQSERLLAMMAGISDPVGIWATPSYAVRLAEVAAGLGIEPRSVGLRHGYFSGEAGLQVPGYRERIEDTWGMVARDQYGTGELGLHSGECAARDVPGDRHAALAREVEARLKADLDFSAAVTPVAPGTIAGDGKTRRVIRSFRGEVV